MTQKELRKIARTVIASALQSQGGASQDVSPNANVTVALEVLRLPVIRGE